MIAIVNINKSRGIGINGELLANIPEDMNFFRKKTAGKAVLMGRKTLESFPGMKPLKGRINFVLTSAPDKIKEESRAAAESFIIVNGISQKDISSGSLSCGNDLSGECSPAAGAHEKNDIFREKYKNAAREISKALAENDRLNKIGAKASEKHTLLAAVDSKETFMRLYSLIQECCIAEREDTDGLAELSKTAEKNKKCGACEIYVIGGASIYSLFLPECDKCLVTVNDSKEKADAFFPGLDNDEEWELSEKGEEQLSESGYRYSFNTYKRVM